MIAEQITITTTPTSIQQLIATARLALLDSIPPKCVGIMLRYAAAETAVVSLTDDITSAGAVVLDAVTESLLSTTFSQFSIAKALLSCDTGTVVVHVIINQQLF